MDDKTLFVEIDPVKGEEIDPYFTRKNLFYIKKGIEQIRNGQVVIHDLIEDSEE